MCVSVSVCVCVCVCVAKCELRVIFWPRLYIAHHGSEWCDMCAVYPNRRSCVENSASSAIFLPNVLFGECDAVICRVCCGSGQTFFLLQRHTKKVLSVERSYTHAPNSRLYFIECFRFQGLWLSCLRIKDQCFVGRRPLGLEYDCVKRYS